MIPNAPRQLMALLDAFKSVGFDHVRQTNLEQFSARLKEIRSPRTWPKNRRDHQLSGQTWRSGQYY